MGKGASTSGVELAAQVVTGSFTGATNGTSAVFTGTFNFVISGTFVATIELQRSFDGGATFVPVGVDSLGTPADYTAPASVVWVESEPGVLYRAACTAFTSGTAVTRLSGGPRVT